MKIKVGIFPQESCLWFHAKEQRHILAAQKAIDLIVIGEDIEVKEERAYILKTPTWSEFIDDKKMKHQNQFDVSIQWDERYVNK